MTVLRTYLKSLEGLLFCEVLLKVIYFFIVMCFKFGQYIVLSGFQLEAIEQTTSWIVFILKKKHKTSFPTGYNGMFPRMAIQTETIVPGAISTGHFIHGKHSQ